MLAISDIFRKHFHPAMEKLEVSEDQLKQIASMSGITGDATYYYPVIIGSVLSSTTGLAYISEMVNIGVCFYLWRQAPRSQRNIYRCTVPTADYLRSVNLTFVPEDPPPSWANGCFIIESTSYREPLAGDVFSIAVYRTMDRDRRLRYFFICLDINGGASVFSIAASAGKLNQKMLESNLVLNESMEMDLGFDGDKFMHSLPVIKFILAASYYVTHPEIEIASTHGPIMRQGKKVTRKGGRLQSFWSYRTIHRGAAEPTPGTGERGPLDKDSLSLEPVIVGPHIRRIKDRVVLVDSYDSHRWKKLGGTRIKV